MLETLLLIVVVQHRGDTIVNSMNLSKIHMRVSKAPSSIDALLSAENHEDRYRLKSQSCARVQRTLLNLVLWCPLSHEGCCGLYKINILVSDAPVPC